MCPTAADIICTCPETSCACRMHVWIPSVKQICIIVTQFILKVAMQSVAKKRTQVFRVTKLLYNSKAVRNTSTASNTVRNCACERKFIIIRDTKTFDSCSLSYYNTKSYMKLLLSTLARGNLIQVAFSLLLCVYKCQSRLRNVTARAMKTVHRAQSIRMRQPCSAREARHEHVHS